MRFSLRYETHSLVKALEAARDGFNAVAFDLSTLPLEENAKQTKDAVEALKSINPGILVEGEIGDSGSGSEIHDDASRAAPRLTTASEARHFVEATRIDILAPSVGNAHGMRRNMVAGEERKHLNIDRIREIKRRRDGSQSQPDDSSPTSFIVAPTSLNHGPRRGGALFGDIAN